MQMIKKIRAFRCVGLRRSGRILAIVFAIIFHATASFASCIAPERPFVPSDPDEAKRYADLLRQDFEFYLRDAQAYFRCLDEERRRAFDEAQEVSEAYKRFLNATHR